MGFPEHGRLFRLTPKFDRHGTRREWQMTCMVRARYDLEMHRNVRSRTISCKSKHDEAHVLHYLKLWAAQGLALDSRALHRNMPHVRHINRTNLPNVQVLGTLVAASRALVPDAEAPPRRPGSKRRRSLVDVV